MDWPYHGKKSAGVGDEPKWEKFIDFVGVPPKERKEKAAASTSGPENGSDQLLRAMIIQNQQSTQLFQTYLLATSANQQSTMMQLQVQYNPPISCSFWIPITFLTTTEKDYMYPKTHHCSKRNGAALLLLHFHCFSLTSLCHILYLRVLQWHTWGLQCLLPPLLYHHHQLQSTLNFKTAGRALKEKMKDVAHYTQAECLAFLEANNLSRLVPKFVEAEVDGKP